MKKIYHFIGKCEHCDFKIKTAKADFSGGIGSGKPMGFYTRCPKCKWETEIYSTDISDWKSRYWMIK